MTTHTTTPLAHIDITPPSALLYATTTESDRCPSVALLHNEASPLQLLGFAHGRCRELAMLASFASRSDGAEGELMEAAEHLWNGLETFPSRLAGCTCLKGCTPGRGLR